MEEYAKCQNEKLALLQHEVRAARNGQSGHSMASSLCSEEACPLMANESFRVAVFDHLQPLRDRVSTLEGALESAQNDIGQLSGR